MLTVDPARLELGPGRRVLDLGCGSGRHAFAAWRSQASVVALDTSLEDLTGVAGMLGAMCEVGELAEVPSGGVLAGDAYALPFADDSFDVVIASEVLEHLEEDTLAMRELHRVLRPDGVVAVSVPRFGPEIINWLLSREYHDRPGGHVRIYRRRTLIERLSSTGLSLVGIDYRHGLHAPYWWLRCALGVDRPERRPVAAFHRLLVWEIEHQPLVTRVLGALLDPLIGKSLVLYLAPTREAVGAA